MPLNQNFIHFFRVFKSFKNKDIAKKFLNWTYFVYLFSILIFYLIFLIISNLIDQKNKIESQNLHSMVKTKDFLNLNDYLISKINSPYKEVKYLIKNNDSIEKILKKYKINARDIKNISYNLKQKNLNNIYAGRELSLVLKKLDDGSSTVVNLVYPVNNTLSIEIRKSQDNFIIKENILQLYKKEVVIRSKIKSNLYSAAIGASIEPNIIVEFARIFGFEVDFQRDIRKGDWFEILYERFEDDNNIVKDTGKIIYASMYVNGAEINLYNFKDNKDTGFYDLKGKSIVKSLMKTPINGARLSSSFGMRKHPILGYNKMHKGLDFSAKKGTPIYAAGNGTVERANIYGGYGRYIRIKHNSEYKTAYAHLYKFAKGIIKGKYVNQGDIIGYVGSSGRSTGPHLHYEVIYKNKQVDPYRLKIPEGKKLDKENFIIFKENKKKILKELELRKAIQKF